MKLSVIKHFLRVLGVAVCSQIPLLVMAENVDDYSYRHPGREHATYHYALSFEARDYPYDLNTGGDRRIYREEDLVFIHTGNRVWGL